MPLPSEPSTRLFFYVPTCGDLMGAGALREGWKGSVGFSSPFPTHPSLRFSNYVPRTRVQPGRSPGAPPGRSLQQSFAGHLLWAGACLGAGQHRIPALSAPRLEANVAVKQTAAAQGESQPPTPPRAARTRGRSADSGCVGPPSPHPREPPSPPAAPGESRLLPPALQCQPLFGKCRALSDRSSHKLLVSVMLTDSQMCVRVGKLRGAPARAWLQNRRVPRLRPGVGTGAGGLQEHPADLKTPVPADPSAPAPLLAQDWHRGLWPAQTLAEWALKPSRWASAPPFLKGTL
ncbi:protein FAM189B-like [Panthera tigris]|uniref:protein FAM189B-like n=1 Tax=Panthera tigris TaxID=9694 RepID=UPI001C6FB0A5|nr:protein FAM189B-like [Panthera tigris]